MDKILEDMGLFLQKGNLNEVIKLSTEAVTGDYSSSEVLDALLAGMAVIGGKFKRNEVFVPEVLIAARAMNGGLDVLKPYLAADGAKSIGTVIIGTVKGDLHDIGKNLVSMMMVGAGFDVIDLGVDVSAEKFIAAIEEHNPDVMCMSALLTTTMTNMSVIIEAIKEKELRNSVKIMVGGAPLTDDYAEEIGADAYSGDAATAADTAKAYVVA